MVTVEHRLTLKEMSINPVEALLVLLQRVGKELPHGAVMPCADGNGKDPKQSCIGSKLKSMLCCPFAKQDSPTSVCHTKHNFGRLEIYGMAGLADEGLDRRTLALQAFYNFLALPSRRPMGCKAPGHSVPVGWRLTSTFYRPDSEPFSARRALS